MASLVGYVQSNGGNVPVYRDAQGCYIDIGGDIYPVDCQGIYPASGAQSTPPFIAGNTSSPGGGYIQPGASWFNDILNTLLGLTALGNQGTIQGGSINPNVQPNYSYPQGGISQSQAEQLAAYQRERSAGGQFGASIQDFVSKNSVLIMVGVLGFVLFRSGRK